MYGIHLSGLERGPGNLVFQKKCSSPSPAVGAPAFLRQNDDGVLKSSPNFVTEVADIFLQTVREGDVRIALEVVKVLTITGFVLNSFKQYIESLLDCGDMIATTMKIIKDDEFQLILVRCSGAENNGHSALYMKYMPEMLREQVQLCREENIIFHPVRRAHFKTCLSKYEYGLHSNMLRRREEGGNRIT